MWTQRRRPVGEEEAEEEMKMSLYSFHTLSKRLPEFVLPASNFRLAPPQEVRTPRPKTTLVHFGLAAAVPVLPSLFSGTKTHLDSPMTSLGPDQSGVFISLNSNLACTILMFILVRWLIQFISYIMILTPADHHLGPGPDFP